MTNSVKPVDKFAKFRELSEEDRNSINAMVISGETDKISGKTVGQKIADSLNDVDLTKKSDGRGRPKKNKTSSRKITTIYLEPEILRQIKTYIADSNNGLGVKSVSDFIELSATRTLKGLEN